jgi:hypothetical protein
MKRMDALHKQLLAHHKNTSHPIVIFTPKFKYLVSTALIASLGIIWAFAWKDFWSELFLQWFNAGFFGPNPLVYRLVYAFFATALALFGIWIVALWVRHIPKKER